MNTKSVEGLGVEDVRSRYRIEAKCQSDLKGQFIELLVAYSTCAERRHS